MSMRDRTCVVTGATSGIGEVTALELARKGADVVIVARDPAKARATCGRIAEETGREPGSVIGDLSRMDDVRRIGEEILARHDRIDVLVNNAGAIFQQRYVTDDGFEQTFALNHLSYFLLTHLLAPALRAAPSARIVNVASDAHRGRIDFDDLQSERRFVPFAVYSRSKLMNILFTYELARRLEGSGITANALHPGVVRTGFGRNDGGIFSWLVKLTSFAYVSPEAGASTSVHLASAPEVEGITGRYWSRCRPKRSSRASYDVDVQRRLWSVSEELLGIDSASHGLAA